MTLDRPNRITDTADGYVDGCPAGAGRIVKLRASDVDAAQIYVLLRRADGSNLMLTQMDWIGRDQWTVSVPLSPGIYRYRCYANDGRVTRYIAPKQPGDLPFQMLGLDAVFFVPPQQKPPTAGATMRLREN